METALIFAGGECLHDHLADDLPMGDLVVAADSGYDAALGLGFRVDVLVGDLDSIRSTDIPGHVIVERHSPDKDETDLELALGLVAREGPSRVIVVGGAGGRLDHEVAVTGLLCSDRWRAIEEIDWVSNRAHAYVVRRRRVIHGDMGTLVTLVPMHGDASGVTTMGLHWALDHETLFSGTTRGVSNMMDGPVADIRVESGCLLVITGPFDDAQAPDR